jgi:hypothetical protein
MGKKMYAPGELDNVKKRLGSISNEEATRMQRVLGGEIGYERNARTDSDEKLQRRRGGGTAQAPPRPKRLVETVSTSDVAVISDLPKFKRLGAPSYMERVKMDVCAGSLEFGIKTTFQVLISRLSFFGAPQDKVSSWFVKNTLNEYYEKLERLVTSTRLFFPRSNIELGRKLQAKSHDAFKILNVIRQWKLDVIASEISKIQSRPRNVFVRDFETMLREIYKPIYVLEKIDINGDVRDALQTLYDIRFIEQPTKETEGLHNKIPEIVLALKYVCFTIRRMLYPLLMKTIALYYQEYEAFFIENNENYKSFLGVSEADQLTPVSHKTGFMDRLIDSEKMPEIAADTVPDDMAGIYTQSPDDLNKQQEKQVSDTGEAKALERGLKMLETLFPKAPWNNLESFPDF